MDAAAVTVAGTFNDPIPSDGQRLGRISASQLLRAWMNSDAPMAALAIAGPR